MVLKQQSGMYSVQELLLRLVEDYYPLPSNPSQADPGQSRTPSPHPAAASGAPSRAEAAAAARMDKKRKSCKAPDELSPKSRRTKRSIKASKGIAEGQHVKAELEDAEACAGGEIAYIFRSPMFPSQESPRRHNSTTAVLLLGSYIKYMSENMFNFQYTL